MKKLGFAAASFVLLFVLASCANNADSGSDNSGGQTAVAVTAIKVTAAGNATYVVKGRTLQLTTAVTPSDATDATVTWSSSDTKAATVDAKGLVTAVASSSKVTITATANDGSKTAGTIDLAVKETAPVSVTGITVTAEGGAASVENGSTIQLTASVLPDNAADKSVTWSSSDTSSATVDADGLVTAKAVTDKVTITATANDGSNVKGTIDLAVTAVPSTSAIPVLATTTMGDTKILGAGIWIFLDNSSLGITDATAASILSGLTVTVSDTATSTPVSVTGSQLDNANSSFVRLYVTMQDATYTTVTVAISGTINGTDYAGNVKFNAGVYQAE